MNKQKDDRKQDDEKKQKQLSQEEFEKLQTEFSNLQELTQRLDSQLKRAVADYQNLEKRVEEGRSELSSWATSELIKKILPVLDHFEKAIKGVSEEERQSGWVRGVELALQQLRGVLKDEGLEEIVTDPSTALGTGVQFDPTFHEAVDSREPSSAEATVGKGENDILEVVEKGYTLNGKVLKPAKVVVGKANTER